MSRVSKAQYVGTEVTVVVEVLDLLHLDLHPDWCNCVQFVNWGSDFGFWFYQNSLGSARSSDECKETQGSLLLIS